MCHSVLLQRALLRWPAIVLLVGGVVWVALYSLLYPLSVALLSLLPVDQRSPAGQALQFFLYDTPKVLLLLTGWCL